MREQAVANTGRDQAVNTLERAQHSFNKLVASDLRSASAEDLAELALSVWHEKFVPDVSQLKGAQALKAGYLLDRLMRYDVVKQEQKKNLVHTVSLLRTTNTLQLPVDRKSDKLAAKWGIDEDVRSQLQKLMPYQTRHYRHKSGSQFNGLPKVRYVKARVADRLKLA